MKTLKELHYICRCWSTSHFSSTSHCYNGWEICSLGTMPELGVSFVEVISSSCLLFPVKILVQNMAKESESIINVLITVWLQRTDPHKLRLIDGAQLLRGDPHKLQQSVLITWLLLDYDPFTLRTFLRKRELLIVNLIATLFIVNKLNDFEPKLDWTILIHFDDMHVVIVSIIFIQSKLHQSCIDITYCCLKLLVRLFIVPYAYMYMPT